MRTTIDLDEELLRTAKDMAAARGKTLSHVITELAWKGLSPAKPVRRHRNGFPLLPARPGAGMVTAEHVHDMLNRMDLEDAGKT